MIVTLASYPRSGNTFFRILLKELYGLTTYSVYDDPLFADIGASDAVGHASMPMAVSEMRYSKDIFVVKTHEFPAEEDRVIYIIRDGRSCAVSLSHYLMDFERKHSYRAFAAIRSEWARRKILKDIVRTENYYGGWSRHVSAWTTRGDAAITKVVRYESLLEDPVAVMQEALEAVVPGIEPLSSYAIPDFHHLCQRWPRFFRKGRPDGWKREMPRRLQKDFELRHGDVMRLWNYL